MRALRRLAFSSVFLATALAGIGAAEAKGCIKGAIVGGIAGHYAGHHGFIGAVGGCIAGRHLANRNADRGPAPARQSPEYGPTGPVDRSY